jgi:uncharacterized membrane protein
MFDNLKFFLGRVRERLWVKPVLMCILSIAGVFLAKAADNTELGQIVPEIDQDSIEKLLSILSSSMLVIAVFAVASMIAAYTSASNAATPRSFSLVIADDISQNALSTFIGAFIFSIVAIIVLKNGYYDQAGRFALFALTLMIFVIVIAMFVRWVDRIARLGRLGETSEKVEAAAAAAILRRRIAPRLGGVPVGLHPRGYLTIHGNSIGYVQRIDINMLQKYATEMKFFITVASLPGTFSAPGRVLAYLSAETGDFSTIDITKITQAFLIGKDRKFDEDPRFGLVVLSEIAGKALSSAVNDPGTAIMVIGSLVRLFALWSKPIDADEIRKDEFDRIAVPIISLSDMFDDAFTAIARDGAGTVEVAIRLQKAFESLASMGDGQMRDIAVYHSRLALARSEKALELPEDLELVRKQAKFATSI